ncbi:MAG: flagellar hook-length control protein FliK [Candidatus Brocadiaceae bacterium]|nr:flagellar hook-length control protein FliK [Candidatus Brocadiaceae bacterium]
MIEKFFEFCNDTMASGNSIFRLQAGKDDQNLKRADGIGVQGNGINDTEVEDGSEKSELIHFHEIIIHEMEHHEANDVYGFQGNNDVLMNQKVGNGNHTNTASQSKHCEAPDGFTLKNLQGPGKNSVFKITGTAGEIPMGIQWNVSVSTADSLTNNRQLDKQDKQPIFIKGDRILSSGKINVSQNLLMEDKTILSSAETGIINKGSNGSRGEYSDLLELWGKNIPAGVKKDVAMFVNSNLSKPDLPVGIQQDMPVSTADSLTNNRQLDKQDRQSISMKGNGTLSLGKINVLQNLPAENKTVFSNAEISIPANTVSNHAVEREHGKTGDAVSSQDNVTGEHQSKKEGTFTSDSSSKDKNSSDIESRDTHAQKTKNATSFLAGRNTADSFRADGTDLQNKSHFSQRNDTISVVSSRGGFNPMATTTMVSSSNTAGVEQIQNTIIEQIFQRMQVLNRGGRSEITMHLNPEELGSVRIHFAEEKGEIEAKILVESFEVKAAVENSIHRLRESLSSHGVEINKLEIAMRGEDEKEHRLGRDFKENNSPGNSADWKDNNEEVLEVEDDTSHLSRTKIDVNGNTVSIDYIL